MDYDKQVERQKKCRCPACDSGYTIYNKTGDFHWCRRCGYEFIITPEGEVKERET